MKVTPIKDYREPRYPTIAEIDSVDLSRATDAERSAAWRLIRR